MISDLKIVQERLRRTIVECYCAQIKHIGIANDHLRASTKRYYENQVGSLGSLREKASNLRSNILSLIECKLTINSPPELNLKLNDLTKIVNTIKESGIPREWVFGPQLKLAEKVLRAFIDQGIIVATSDLDPDANEYALVEPEPRNFVNEHGDQTRLY